MSKAKPSPASAPPPTDEEGKAEAGPSHPTGDMLNAQLLAKG